MLDRRLREPPMIDLRRWTPRLLHPEYSWPCPTQWPVSTTTPPTPARSTAWSRWFWGHVHRLLLSFGLHYARWYGLNVGLPVIPLPFGLVLKKSDRVTEAEAAGMQMARAAGMPVPRLLSYGEHPHPELPEASILMTRLPGKPMANYPGATWDIDVECHWFEDIAECYYAMQQWENPWGEQICSAAGGPLIAQHIPRHRMEPCASYRAFCEHFLSFRFLDYKVAGYASQEAYDERVRCVKEAAGRQQRITFAHGDFKPHNFLIDNDWQISGILDWESSGWYPEYWDVAVNRRFGRSTWWSGGIDLLCGGRWETELKADIAMAGLATDSITCF